MFESKYSKVLTVILVIVLIAIVGLLGFLGYDFYKKYTTSQEASDFVDNFMGDTSSGNQNNNSVVNNVDTSAADELLNNVDTNTSTSTSTNTATATREKYKGFYYVGTISIPSVSIEYPILEEMSTKALETAVVALYPPKGVNINKPGNTVIVGHNYRNGLFFSNLKKVKIGDKVTIKDYTGLTKTYTVYEVTEKDQSDTTFYQRDTGGKAEITLSTCTDASNNIRTIVLAREDG